MQRIGPDSSCAGGSGSLPRTAVRLLGLYSDKTNVTFDDFTATDGAVRDPLIPRFVGPAATSISSGTLRVQSGTRGGKARVTRPRP